ncbi:pentatricopeptide repeat-containing protein 1, mitochondrial [Trichomycterus rosablanca]|uniref:pentatricopeptide repeat-containing protein 1, mitochondrial n=1 Tax=Trichomycterus rosablanca TaxID=2290929 RepID=UPI002F355F8D
MLRSVLGKAGRVWNNSYNISNVQSRVCRCAHLSSITSRSFRTEPHTDPSPEPGTGTQPGRADEDHFGDYTSSFSSRTSFQKASPEQHDLKYTEAEAERHRSKPSRPNTQYWYLLQCKQLIKRHKLAEALVLFENDMLKVERLQPEEFNYTVLIGGCGRAGYIKKAFKLYNDMKKRGLEPSGATYTALFNACAESPWKQSGLEQAMRLRQELRRKNVALNAITHHALLKAVARSGDLKSCFQVLREMLQAGQAITQETFQYLLMCCVEDKQQGFRLALQVWHQMLSAGIKPDGQNYNILLRAARDCGIGSPALASTLLLRVPEESSPKTKAHRKGPRLRLKERISPPNLLDVDAFERRLFAAPPLADTPSRDQRQGKDGTYEAPQINDHTPESTQSLVPVSQINDPIGSPSCPSPIAVQKSRLPNLLDPSTCHSGVVGLGAADTASDRLALIGDLDGFLNQMVSDGSKPTIKTLTLLADVTEPSSQSVQSLIQVADQVGVKLDVAFFNTLIRKAAKAGDLQGAKALKVLMQERKLHPNPQTFCSVALACSRQEDGLQLLSDMESCGVAPNAHVFSALIGQATRRLDYTYLHELLRQMHQLQVPPNEVVIRQLEFASQYPPNYDQFKSKNIYLEKIDGFRGFYKQWLEFMPAQETPHPWEKFRLAQSNSETDGADDVVNESR